jgi:hydrogenase maturation protease
MNQKVLVFGMGDTCQTDDGIGVHVINYLKKKNCLKNAEIVDGTLLPTNLTEAFSDIDQLIVIETAEFNSAPGSVKVFEGIEMDAFVTRHKMNCVHKTGLNHILNLTRSHGRLPTHRALVGIQPASLGEGIAPSEKVARAIPKACQRVFEISSNWMI